MKLLVLVQQGALRERRETETSPCFALDALLAENAERARLDLAAARVRVAGAEQKPSALWKDLK